MWRPRHESHDMEPFREKCGLLSSNTNYYRVTLVVANLGWVDLNLDVVCPTLLQPMGVWQRMMMEHPNQSQPNPGSRPPASPCTVVELNLHRCVFMAI